MRKICAETKRKTNMAEHSVQNNGNIRSCQTCENERNNEASASVRFETVELNAVDGDVSDISDEECTSGAGSASKKRPRKKVKKKRRSKSFTSNDEESSTDDEIVTAVKSHRKIPNNLNMSDLSWTMWMWYYVVAVSMGAFHFAEYLGEKLADFFGITAPKYQYVIDEYYRMKQEEKEEKEQEEREQEHVQKKESEKLASLEGGDEQNMETKPDVNQP